MEVWRVSDTEGVGLPGFQLNGQYLAALHGKAMNSSVTQIHPSTNFPRGLPKREVQNGDWQVPTVDQ